MTSNESWVYENTQINNIGDFDENAVGFIYKIINKTNNKFYIGRKILRNTTNKAITKKEAKIRIPTRGRVPKKKKVITESDWKTYYGSSKELLKDVKELGKENFERIILKVVYSKIQLTYYEMEYQVKLDVLKNSNCYNENILSKFFREDM